MLWTVSYCTSFAFSDSDVKEQSPIEKFGFPQQTMHLRWCVSVFKAQKWCILFAHSVCGLTHYCSSPDGLRRVQRNKRFRVHTIEDYQKRNYLKVEPVSVEPTQWQKRGLWGEFARWMNELLCGLEVRWSYSGGTTWKASDDPNLCVWHSCYQWWWGV